MARTTLTSMWLLLGMAALPACDDGVSSDEEAEVAYLGLDVAVERALLLGFDGFNSASSANIDPQSTNGDVGGTLTVTGQVDQGASDNKGMRLFMALTDYSDEIPNVGDNEDINVIYDTDPAALPALNLTLRNIPDGTLEGTLVGTFFMEGDLEGEVAISLTFAGEIEPDPLDATKVRRVEGSTTIVGTATAGDDVFEVNLTR
jgi:hypothetical protein